MSTRTGHTASGAPGMCTLVRTRCRGRKEAIRGWLGFLGAREWGGEKPPGGRQVQGRRETRSRPSGSSFPEATKSVPAPPLPRTAGFGFLSLATKRKIRNKPTTAGLPCRPADATADHTCPIPVPKDDVSSRVPSKDHVQDSPAFHVPSSTCPTTRENRGHRAVQVPLSHQERKPLCQAPDVLHQQQGPCLGTGSHTLLRAQQKTLYFFSHHGLPLPLTGQAGKQDPSWGWRRLQNVNALLRGL